MFRFILFVIVMSYIVRLFTRPFFGYYRPRIYPFGGFGGWGMGMGYPYGPMWYGPRYYRRPMGFWRRW